MAPPIPPACRSVTIHSLLAEFPPFTRYSALNPSRFPSGKARAGLLAVADREPVQVLCGCRRSYPKRKNRSLMHIKNHGIINPAGTTVGRQIKHWPIPGRNRPVCWIP